MFRLEEETRAVRENVVRGSMGCYTACDWARTLHLDKRALRTAKTETPSHPCSFATLTTSPRRMTQMRPSANVPYKVWPALALGNHEVSLAPAQQNS
jgi:hypothetical protein